MEDDKIMDLFWARDQAAIEETSTKYGGRLQRLAVKILYRGYSATSKPLPCKG
ncbi:hypothetical protein [Lawsonibacter sp. JLR.KK007]|uniref:hypothetical protein n=1 Tax=Lawsonibacter sp. JLR.KK007 TaxID=3114293 RepID=UPI002FF027E8